MWNGTTENIPVKAVDMEHYDEQPDVILVCVKGYSLDDTVPFIRKVMKKNTIVIPILNIYGTGGRLAEATAGDSCNRWLYLCGSSDQRARCIRAVRQGAEPCIWCAGSVRKPSGTGGDPGRSGICGIRALLSHHIQRAALEKFSYVSPIGAAGLYYNATAADFMKEGAPRKASKK